MLGRPARGQRGAALVPSLLFSCPQLEVSAFLSRAANTRTDVTLDRCDNVVRIVTNSYCDSSNFFLQPFCKYSRSVPQTQEKVKDAVLLSCTVCVAGNGPGGFAAL
ncbi:hypothetical protein H920_12213 [Fukomys damarensis]|uniref:Uncharacterized protein n=1 Tax=Fukomys damarensis TaxID=885580 RepID=A0A091DUD8_FUKDA|nr:hypothetical protein H920_12213 [Fukomys damarensis]